MRRCVGATLCLFAAIAAGPRSGSAPERFDAFFERFRAAVVARDWPAVADATALPFLFSGSELDQEGLLDALPTLFDARVRACFAAPQAVSEDDLEMVFCAGTIYVFGRPGPGAPYRFLEIGVDD